MATIPITPITTPPTTPTAGDAFWVAKGAGWGRLSFLLTGPAAGDADDDLNASATAAETIEHYFDTITGMFVGGAATAASGGVIPVLITVDGNASTAIVNYFEAGTASSSLDQCDNADDLRTMGWWVTIEGTPVGSAT
jgi:hypothetical protein